MQTWQTYVKGDLDLWEGHFSQVLISTIDGSKHQAKLQLQTNAKLIGTTNAKLQMMCFLTFKKLECLDFPDFL